ncbi:putative oligosaccharyltransferase complex subunit ostc [Iris pallida]|uniref:Oligosaccharyltransferase complex subunit ostc n=1 Tax=Iris pallida TaxID=29817 RepID=A0AAX6G8Y1_IRIPA|nr:putative oligosaccharyltransferase complex subunit ostc [Iris pallida]
MRPKSDQSATTGSAAAAAAGGGSLSSMDPLLHLLSVLPFSFLRPPKTRLKLPSSLPLPSATTILSLLLLTYLAVVSGLVYDVIVEPPGIGSTQDPRTGTVRPVVFLPGRVNGQYIIEGLSSGFMFLVGGVGIILLDLALDRNRERSVRISFAAFGISSVVISYIMAMLFIRIKIPSYLW